MKAVASIFIVAVLLTCFTANGRTQAKDGLVTRMRQHESSIFHMYLEYQKLYYEDKSRVHELAAFEKLLSVYIDQVMEIYETISLSVTENREPRDIASRALTLKSLMFLEKAPLNFHFFERACYQYYESLNVYEGTNEPPALYKDLPHPIQAGSKTYYRLVDLLEEKGRGLQDFGKVKISFRNFMVTANFEPDNLELVKLSQTGSTSGGYTFELAETRIREAFAKVFRKSTEIETYVALPAGTYLLRLRGSSKSDFTTLTRFYVRANQQNHYVMEPLADWIILYEHPTDKRPDYYKYQRNKSTFGADAMASNVSLQNSNESATNWQEKNGSNGQTSTNHVTLVMDSVRDLLPAYEIKVMFDFNDPEVKDNAIDIISRAIVEYAHSPEYYDCWSSWTASWRISQKVREVVSPGSLIPIELLELVYRVLGEL